MNDKKKVISIWLRILICSTIINILFLIFTKINKRMIAIIIEAILCLWNLTALGFFILTFSIQYKRFEIDDNVIEVYEGFSKHYIKVNGEIKDEYVSDFSLTDIKMSYVLNGHTITVTVTPSNYVIVKCDNELIK